MLFQAWLFPAWLFPACCPVCRRAGAAPCEPCAAVLPVLARRLSLEGVDAVAVPFAYAGGVRQLVAALKYRGNRAALGWTADRLAGAIVASPAARRGSLPAVVTWAPTSGARRRARGFDQAELLARAVSRRLGLPCRRLLWRSPGPVLTGRPGRDRTGAVAFTARGPAPPSVLVVDDVITTGTTAVAAATALRRAGAETVWAAAIAHTPPPGAQSLVSASGRAS